MTEQWTGDWMRDAETGQLIDGPTMTRREMFLLIRELRAVIHAHAQTIRDKQAVIEALKAEDGRLRYDATERAAKQLCHMCRDGYPVKRYPGGWFHDTLNEPSVYGSWPFGCSAGAIRIAAEHPSTQDKAKP